MQHSKEPLHGTSVAILLQALTRLKVKKLVLFTHYFMIVFMYLSVGGTCER